MADSRERRLENAIAAVQQRHGAHALQRGDALGAQAVLPHVSTGFPAVDAITGCGGAPLGMITLLSGRSTSGKLTLAYKILANAQHTAQPGARHTVGLLDLSRTADPDYVTRCGVDLDHLLVGRPSGGRQAVEMIGDLVLSGGLRALAVDSLTELAAHATLRHLNARLPRLQQVIRARGCALIFLDEPCAPWLRWLNLDASRLVRWAAALHIEMQRERWLQQAGELTGYQAQARLLKSRWVYGIRSAPVAVLFNGTVKAQETW